MAPHIKFGDGFKIIYGGKRGIQWIFDQSISQNVNINNSLLPTSHSATPFLEGLNVAAQYLQWWEQRKQNQLAFAQHEERRIPWLVDIMNTFYEEFQTGHLNVDTLFYFETEVTKLFKRVQENNLLDVPGTLLLQISRTTNLLIQINSSFFSKLPSIQPNFILKGMENRSPFQYKPSIDVGEEELESYLNSIQAIRSLFEAASVALRGSAFSIAIAGSAILWGYQEYLKFKKKNEDRDGTFLTLRNLAIELRNSSTLMLEVQALPQIIEFTASQDLLEGKEGKSYKSENGQLLEFPIVCK